jgi:TRAP-type C4-dicarboxylate transport system substrate-binding protein
MMRTLGATPVDLPFGAPLADLDGVEAPVNTVQGNRYDAHGGFLTANVALSARPLVVFAGSRRFASLTAAQRTILIRAVSACRVVRARRRKTRRERRRRHPPAGADASGSSTGTSRRSVAPSRQCTPGSTATRPRAPR